MELRLNIAHQTEVVFRVVPSAEVNYRAMLTIREDLSVNLVLINLALDTCQTFKFSNYRKAASYLVSLGF